MNSELTLHSHTGKAVGDSYVIRFEGLSVKKAEVSDFGLWILKKKDPALTQNPISFYYQSLCLRKEREHI